MSSTRTTPPLRKPRTRRGVSGLRRRLGRRLRGLRPRWAARPVAVRIVIVVAALLIGAPLVNLVVQLVRKPTELLFFADTVLNKPPTETWRHYGARFRNYSTDAVSPELLAALTQTESTGNPAVRTYWRWRWGWNPFAWYRPASSAVGLLQMTDPAFAEASRFCIRGHVVVSDCWFTSLYFRSLPGHAIELASIYLDRQTASVLIAVPGKAPSAPQKQDLAAVIHLCGAGPGRAFVRRGFRPAPGERCGDHSVAGYLGRVNAMKQQFVRLAANNPG
ncbi:MULTISPECIES: lytic transglycosylase domain-containing protein [unclassified Tardiphaga]|uniref:lytic transglycosylase domain-containing protein n=1 Tax=unclassified Tardiphaga TaxID=2631404 RepID=UPI001FF05864|nr:MULTISPECIES: lytic transglycosylase domain-containing protein [unclassified Tardiphaga]